MKKIVKVLGAVSIVAVLYGVVVMILGRFLGEVDGGEE